VLLRLNPDSVSLSGKRYQWTAGPGPGRIDAPPHSCSESLAATTETAAAAAGRPGAATARRAAARRSHGPRTPCPAVTRTAACTVTPGGRLHRESAFEFTLKWAGG
jgi:hypothetical protein